VDDPTFLTRAGILKRGILLFWWLWVTLVALTNSVSELKAFGVMPQSWLFNSGNYSLIAHSTATFGTPAWVDRLLLLVVILWQALASVLFWRALRAYHRRRPGRWPRIYVAFTVLLALFGAFMLSDEILHAYHVESAHREIAILLLVSVVALYLLPDAAPIDA